VPPDGSGAFVPHRPPAARHERRTRGPRAGGRAGGAGVGRPARRRL